MARYFPAVLIVLSFGVISCGGKGGSTTSPTAPSNPTPTPTTTNHKPVISSVVVTPVFGVSQLTTFTMSASASDEDGDALSYTWDLAGNPASGAVVRITFGGNGGVGTARVTVADGRGGSATDSRTFTVGSASGTWRGSGVALGSFTMKLTQTGAAITGTYSDVFGGGQIDPAQPGSITSGGKVEMRVKQGPFTDWNFRGQMDTTGRRITGSIYGSGFNGQAFTLDKQ
jgi:hypothetical protein